MRRWWSVLLLTLLVTLPMSASAPMTNEDVLTLHRSGLPASVIVAKVNEASTAFDTSVEAILALNEAGVPSTVIEAMVAAQTPAPEVPSSASAGDGSLVVRQGASRAANVQTQFAGTPCTSPGIFAETADGWAEIDPTTFSHSKMSGGMASRLTYGIKSVKSRSILRGTTANIRLRLGSPSFLFCFEESESGLSYETKGATNPSEFLLVAFEVNNKKGQRELVTGKMNAWVGGQAGAPPKFVRDVTHRKLAPGVYRVTPRAILSAGEYAFYYAGSAPLATYGFGPSTGGSKIFAFSVG